MIRRCYESLTSVDKERLLDAMSSSAVFTGPTSQSSREIKSLISTVHLDVYRSGISEWRALISKQKKAEIMLAELERDATVADRQVKKSSRTPAPVRDEIDEIFPAEDEVRAEKQSKKGKDRERSAEVSRGANKKPEPVADVFDENEEKKRKRKRKRPATSSIGVSYDGSAAAAAPLPPSQPRVESHHSTERQSADMDRIRSLQSGKMISLKRLTEELEGDISRKKKSKN